MLNGIITFVDIGHHTGFMSSTNKSLESIKEVIEAVSRKSHNVPHNKTVITRILKESFGGNSKTSLILNINS